jgi:hypothetical protein
MDTIESDFLEEADYGDGSSGSGRERYRILGLTWIGSALLNRSPILSEEEVGNPLR